MNTDGTRIEDIIVAKALEQGASLAGIARVEDLKKSRSFEIYDKNPYYPEYKGIDIKPEHRSVLVWALAHPTSEPVLDWWSLKVPGFTPGNRVLRKQSRRLRIWLGEELGIQALSLPYQIEYGGTFLKDSAVLAGLGVIGKHNLLVTPEFGSDLRLRGIFIEAELEPTGPITDFDPCSGCDAPCHTACPRGAFRNGSYEQARCKQEMDQNDADFEKLEGAVMGIDEPSDVIVYCRKCENACPVGSKEADLDFIMREAVLR
jgi:epoxyqueuosine reductase